MNREEQNEFLEVGTGIKTKEFSKMVSSKIKNFKMFKNLSTQESSVNRNLNCKHESRKVKL